MLAEAEQNSGEAIGSVIAVISYYCYKKDSAQQNNEENNYDEYGQEDDPPSPGLKSSAAACEQANEESEVATIDMKSIKQQQQMIIDELDQKEISNFDSEFE